MIYLDYSATTPVDDEVLDSFNKTCKNYIGNPNSLHKLGFEANKIVDLATIQIANILNVKEKEVIYTSGASEANNLAIKGIALKYQNRGKHIITTNLEHSSIYGPLLYLETLGFTISTLNLDSNGMVDLNHLKSLLTDDTILVSIASVNSEIGLRQPVEQIGRLLKEYPKCFFHVDMTQSIGKIHIDLSDIDLASFSSHKFYGMKGFGCLIKKENINLEPLISGGKSTTVYRSGTPAVPLIVSGAKALRLAYQDLDTKYKHVQELNDYLKEKLKDLDIIINSNDKCIPHILNLSLLNIKPETMLHALEGYDIYISTKSACSNNIDKSRAVYALTNNDDISLRSIRISLSHLTTKAEIDQFIKYFSICLATLKLK